MTGPDPYPLVTDDTGITSWDAACLHLLQVLSETALRTKDDVLIPDIHRYASRGCPHRLLAEMWRWHLSPDGPRLSP